MTAGRPPIPLADKVRRLTGLADLRTAPLPFEWPNPFSQDTDEEAWIAWRFVVDDCEHRKVLANGDRNEVFQYCVFYQRALRAAKEWTGSMTVMDENGVLRLHPALKVEETSWDRVSKLGAKMGLDPVNRNKPLMIQPLEPHLAEGTAGPVDLIAFARDRSRPPPWERDGEPSPDADEIPKAG